MVVIPTEGHVEMDFNRTIFEHVGIGLTIAGIVLLAGGFIVARRRKA